MARVTSSGFWPVFVEFPGLDQGSDELEDPPGNYDPEKLHPELRRRVRRVHARHPLHVNSGHRSSQDQELFFNCAQAKRNTGRCPPGCERSACASANRPGQSNHEAIPYGKPEALAIDMEPQDDDWAPFREVCYDEGLHDPIDQEDWHWQLWPETPASYYEGSP